MRQLSKTGNANSIEYQLAEKDGYWSVRFTDPRSHQQKRMSTKIAVGDKPVLSLRQAHNRVKQMLGDYVPGETQGNVTVGDLVSTLLSWKRTHQPRDYQEKSRNWTLRLEGKFSKCPARELRTRDIEDYKAWALGGEVRNWPPIDSPVSKATVNLDLALLSRAYNMGIEDDVISTKPKFRKFNCEDTVRSGFLTQQEYDRIIATNPPLWLRGMLSMAYEMGNRRGELINLKVGQLDFLNRIVRLDTGTTKNKEGRVAAMSNEMFQLLSACSEGKRATDPVFTRDDHPWQPIGDFRKLWRNTLKAASIDRHILMHDNRRSAVRNMVNRGVPEKVAMTISGHKTRSIFERYNIVNEAEQIAAMQKIEQGKQREREDLAKAATVSPILVRKPDEESEETLQVIVN